MKKLESLTSEQEALMLQTRDFWLDYIFSCKNSINKEKAKINIEWLYKFCNIKNKPIIIYVESPIGCQLAVAYLKEFFKQIKSNVRANIGANVRANIGDNVRANIRANVSDNVGDNVGANIRANVRANVGDNVRDNIRANIGDNVWANIGDNIGDNVRANIGANVRANIGDNVRANIRANVRANKLEWNDFSSYGNISDYGWVSFHDFFTQIGVNNNKDFNHFKELLLSGIYDMIQLERFCIVSNMPEKIKRRDGILHSENGSAIKWRDGYELFYWKGLCVPEKWIMSPESITKEDILKETNAEKRRCLMEILGAKKYYDIISDGNGLTLLDEDNDNQGFPMRLYETINNDSLLNKKVQFLECTCPSTQRVYNIYPPRQNSKNVWEAKADTFNGEKLTYRHGDIGLISIKEQYEHPLIET